MIMTSRVCWHHQVHLTRQALAGPATETSQRRNYDHILTAKYGRIAATPPIVSHRDGD
jgi:hypothetical protein